MSLKKIILYNICVCIFISYIAFNITKQPESALLQFILRNVCHHVMFAV